MFIKLMPDQVTLFWDSIKHGMIESYKIPKEFQQDFAIKELKNLLSGLSQCWIGFQIDKEGNKKLDLIMTSKIIDNKFYGVKVLFVDSLYGFRLITDEIASEVYGVLEKFAMANNCHIISAESPNKRVEELMLNQGFEKQRTSYRKVLHY